MVEVFFDNFVALIVIFKLFFDERAERAMVEIRFHLIQIDDSRHDTFDSFALQFLFVRIQIELHILAIHV